MDKEQGISAVLNSITMYLAVRLVLDIFVHEPTIQLPLNLFVVLAVLAGGTTAGCVLNFFNSKYAVLMFCFWAGIWSMLLVIAR